MQIIESDCLPSEDIEEPYDWSWKKPLGSCGQTISKDSETNKLKFKKAITYAKEKVDKEKTLKILNGFFSRAIEEPLMGS